MRPIDLIVIHCSASPNKDSLVRGVLGQPGFRTPVEVIDRWHRERGFCRDAEAVKRSNPHLTSIGYHYVLYRNGVIATGRSEEEVGAHVRGYNRGSLGICLVGTDIFTLKQWQALVVLVDALHEKYPNAICLGHRDLSPDRNDDGKIEPGEWTKTCPGFDVALWIARRMEPPKDALK